MDSLNLCMREVMKKSLLLAQNKRNGHIGYLYGEGDNISFRGLRGNNFSKKVSITRWELIDYHPIFIQIGDKVNFRSKGGLSTYVGYEVIDFNYTGTHSIGFIAKDKSGNKEFLDVFSDRLIEIR